MHLSVATAAPGSVSWPEAVIFIMMMVVALVLVIAASASFLEFRKLKVTAEHLDQLRALVGRYEQLAERTLDAQQRTAADVAELRVRAGSIEQILRSVD